MAQEATCPRERNNAQGTPVVHCGEDADLRLARPSQVPDVRGASQYAHAYMYATFLWSYMLRTNRRSFSRLRVRRHLFLISSRSRRQPTSCARTPLQRNVWPKAIVLQQSRCVSNVEQPDAMSLWVRWRPSPAACFFGSVFPCFGAADIVLHHVPATCLGPDSCILLSESLGSNLRFLLPGMASLHLSVQARRKSQKVGDRQRRLI